ncbi:hypothetical protein MKS88_004774 [Plasmodium brasilianum]|uniref:Uncharacterized protein n=2 Tax=Plasmodium (Plasmodium) TaxID=418103 RepID=A0A1A8WNX7_PLAMA|nr:conserved Plasmodium protein, unknown function [Plasmodium malariae]KAI4835563.1 hypothetical protein MKS88_004774 [Plasmodium brasilianum]SBS94587.1 conserved Plasmodium protein, unknown function [Plasmodium malariae]SCP02487.1 conserved Plasmodium protein, unknown function [Plasmodium malariae]
MNIEYVEGKDADELIKKIDNNYKECNKYDAYIEEEKEEEEEEEELDVIFQINEKNKTQKNHKATITKSSQNNNINKKETNLGIDNIKNIILKKKLAHNDKNKRCGNFQKGNNRNMFINLSVRKKRIVESSDESDENETSITKKVDYVKKRKNQRK